jgi:hypothetical protein
MSIYLNIPKPETYPPVVYKYRDWDNDFHKKTLMNLELFLSSSANFNDPFDCKIPIAYWKLAEDQTIVREYFHKMVRRQFPQFTREEELNEVEELIKDGRYLDPEWVTSQENKLYEKIEQEFGIISLTEFKDDITMWSHYSNSHK